MLIARLSWLYERLGEKERSTLLQIIVKQFIVDLQGKIIDRELHAPFAFLRNIVEELSTHESESSSSTLIVTALGHSRIDMTLNTYSHIIPTLQKVAADKVDEIFKV